MGRPQNAARLAAKDWPVCEITQLGAEDESGDEPPGERDDDID